ncbi:hypothetical protein CCAX7_57170 [Capsulimonas corticalis]|uniref:Uncharacterized protein n=1 Tax=Capsulimonas corticalis TaxID=2219043 RepID=A0A402D0C3_9BACT|nr:hypothetical protein [Capsulimonas corticalis]BDI33666.1 hypothetical protein CCAX7_57170 [Capsulimonas corticalis]
MLRTVDNGKFQRGQVWKYHARPYEDGSTLTVVKTEVHDRLGAIVHIHLQGLRIRTPRHSIGMTSVIGHLPCSEESITQSVTQLVQENAPLPDFEEGYQQWRDAFDAGGAGIWTVPIAEMVSALESIISAQDQEK